MNKYQKTNTGNLLFKSIVIGGVIGYIVMIVLSFLFSVGLLAVNSVSNGTYTVISSIIFLIGSFIGGVIGGKINRQKGLIVGMSSGGITVLMTMLTAIIINSFEGNYLSVIKIAISVLSSGIGGILAVNKKQTVKL